MGVSSDRALPAGYTGLVVADSRRAYQWESGLRAAGYQIVRVETRGEDADKGAWQIGVVREQASAARGFVTEVMRGDRSLPNAGPRLPALGLASLVAIVCVLTGLVLAAALSR